MKVPAFPVQTRSARHLVKTEPWYCVLDLTSRFADGAVVIDLVIGLHGAFPPRVITAKHYALLPAAHKILENKECEENSRSDFGVGIARYLGDSWSFLVA